MAIHWLTRWSSGAAAGLRGTPRLLTLAMVVTLVGGCAQPTAPPATPTPAPKTPPVSAPATPTAPATTPAAGAGITKPLTIRIGHISSNTSLMEEDAKDFAKQVEAASGGKIKVQVFCCGQIGKQKEMVEQVQLGALEMVVSSSEFVSVVPEFAVWDLPYLFKDRAQIKRAVEGPLGQELAKLAEPKNMVILGFWENGFRETTNGKRPIRTPDDMKGLKIRTPPNPDRVKMFRLWGADAGPLDFSELFSALQTGVFDGQENPMAQITSAKLYEVQKFLSFTDHVYTPTYLVASKKWFDSLEPAAQKLLRETAVKVGDASRARGVKFDQDGVALVKEKGLQVNTDVDKEALKKLAMPLYDDFAKKFGARLIDLAKQATGS